MRSKKPSKASPTKAKPKNKKDLQVFRKISEILTLSGARQKQGRGVTEADLGLEKNQTLVVSRGRIVWLGPDENLPKEFKKRVAEEYDCKGLTVAPGLVECHTHSVFSGNRSAEFEMRNQGVSYVEIAKQGGGILSTMRQTRQAPLRELVKTAQDRVHRFAKQGVTTLESKSGYGLDLENEFKMLKCMGLLKKMRVVPTFLGPHARPPEFASCKAYLDQLIDDVLPRLKQRQLARRCDIFIENGFFEKSDSERYFKAAQDLGFDIVAHAEQLTHSGGAQLAVKYGAVSADHLLQINDSDIQTLSNSETTCVLLPSSDLYMKVSYPKARELIDRGARVALATDFNPGSSPSQDVSLVGLLARLEMKMTLPEVIGAYTVGAAYALKLQDEIGSLEVGKSADFFLSKESWKHFFYEIGNFPCEATYLRGLPSF